MSLEAGTLLSHYRLVEKIGEGGMGVVWRATDTSLGRDVAIKVLPEGLAADAERLARFEREARLLASLNHPSIASIYGLHRHEGVRFLAMELVEGDDLAARLARGPIEPDQALHIALRIAEALESAHENGIIHRDLKPANVKLSADTGSSGEAARVKVLDFGLAKALEGEPGASASGAGLTQSPTITAAMTSAHVILGTAAYMSPEQARGQVADKRSDVWAFGVVLFEMLTGKQLFEGDTVSDTLASVLKIDPDFRLLRAETPARVRTLLRRCLDRDRRRRLRDIGEARIVLDEVLAGVPDAHLETALATGTTAGDAGAAGDGRRPPTMWRNILFSAAGLAIGAAIVGLAMRPGDTETRAGHMPLRKFALGVQFEGTSGPREPVISPDGRLLACQVGEVIYVREFGRLEERTFPYPNPVYELFWSHDGTHLGVIAGTIVEKIDVNSGLRQTVCTLPASAGGAGAHWRADGVIVFSLGDEQGLHEVAAIGGDPASVAAADTTIETDFHDPYVLPGNRGVLLVPHLREGLFESIHLLANGERKELVRMPEQQLEDPVYSPTGHILFHRSPTNPGVWAVPFSLEKLEVTGDPFIVVENASAPSVADDGTLAYLRGVGTLELRLTVNDENGKESVDLGNVQRRAGFTFPAFSPDGRRVCINIDDVDNSELWVFDVARRTRARLSFEDGREVTPAWLPDGERIIYHKRVGRSSGSNGNEILVRRYDGTSAVDTLGEGIIASYSPDGRNVVFTRFGTLSEGDLYRAPVDDFSKAAPMVTGPGLQTFGRVSPDGRYMAYMSSQSGAFEIFLTRFPSGSGRWQVSVGGGMHPRWSADGRRIYYSKAQDMMAADVRLGDAPVLDSPRKLFTRERLVVPTILEWDPGFDVVTSGGQTHFVFYRNPVMDEDPNDVVVVQGWFEEFRGRS